MGPNQTVIPGPTQVDTATAAAGQKWHESGQVIGGDRPVDQATEAFAGVLVDDRHDFDGPAVGGGVKLKVDRPNPVRGVGGR